MMNLDHILQQAVDGQVLIIVCANGAEMFDFVSNLSLRMRVSDQGRLNAQGFAFASGGAIRLRKVEHVDPHYLYGYRVLMTRAAEAWAWDFKPEILNEIRVAQDEYVERMAA